MPFLIHTCSCDLTLQWRRNAYSRVVAGQQDSPQHLGDNSSASSAGEVDVQEWLSGQLTRLQAHDPSHFNSDTSDDEKEQNEKEAAPLYVAPQRQRHVPRSAQSKGTKGNKKERLYLDLRALALSCR